jgi:hypothetical protein
MLITAVKYPAKYIKEESGAELTLPKIITRKDAPELAEKVNIYNGKLDELCTQMNWGLIELTMTILNMNT